ncbi:MAG: hypothetical protein NZ772_06170 [Cyanobacteria bacterium]|nr:hypothetical protein [Cyanobacteriota bacterium]MDW8201072.1 hypothetical protein [Cyanobacteriota bacterium SKYGB_h_bin112]
MLGQYLEFMGRDRGSKQLLLTREKPAPMYCLNRNTPIFEILPSRTIQDTLSPTNQILDYIST